MGRGHLKSVNPGAKLVAVCDVDKGHLKTALEQSGPDVKGYEDFREVIARKDVDIVHIPTPPHWHALISIAAAEAGKDIWCEKPMTRTIWEGEKVVEAVQRNQRIFRLNTWFRFEGGFYGMGTPVKPIKKLVNSGLLGWPLKVTLNESTGFNWKHNWSGRTDLTPQPIPEQLDYDFWLGPAPFKPILRAVPAMVRTAASKSAAVKSASLVLAISSSCARVTVPTFSVLGRPEPLLIPAAFFKRIAAGVVLVTKVNDLSL
jgi:hypothetical protein